MNEQDDFITRHPLLTIFVGAALGIGVMYAGAYFVGWITPYFNAFCDKLGGAFLAYIRGLGK